MPGWPAYMCIMPGSSNLLPAAAKDEAKKTNSSPFDLRSDFSLCHEKHQQPRILHDCLQSNGMETFLEP